jgi:hypothetical protein
MPSLSDARITALVTTAAFSAFGRGSRLAISFSMKNI